MVGLCPLANVSQDSLHYYNYQFSLCDTGDSVTLHIEKCIVQFCKKGKKYNLSYIIFSLENKVILFTQRNYLVLSTVSIQHTLVTLEVVVLFIFATHHECVNVSLNG